MSEHCLDLAIIAMTAFDDKEEIRKKKRKKGEFLLSDIAMIAKALEEEERPKRKNVGTSNPSKKRDRREVSQLISHGLIDDETKFFNYFRLHIGTFEYIATIQN